MDNVESGIVVEKTSGELMKRFAEYCENGRYQVVNIEVSVVSEAFVRYGYSPKFRLTVEYVDRDRKSGFEFTE